MTQLTISPACIDSFNQFSSLQRLICPILQLATTQLTKSPACNDSINHFSSLHRPILQLPTTQLARSPACNDSTHHLPTYRHRLTCLKISSSSRRLLSSICLRPLSSASRTRRRLSASMEKAWILRSSCRRINSLLRKSTTSPTLQPSTWLSASSTSDSYTRTANKRVIQRCTRHILFTVMWKEKLTTHSTHFIYGYVEGRKETCHLTTHSTHFIYGYVEGS